MSTTTRNHTTTSESHLVESDVVTSSATRKVLALLRIAFGLTFLWALSLIHI